MKLARKLVTLAIVLAMVMAFMIPTAMADTAGTITIDGAVKGQTYTAYKVFSVTYSEDVYNYSIDSGSAFYDTISKFADNADNGMTLLQVNDTTTYNVVVDEDTFTAAKAAELAAALNADTSKPMAAGTVTAGDSAATIAVGELGYYFVDSSLGSLCALNTTNNNVTIYEKNALPTLTKTVAENGIYREEATASIGQEVSFKLVANTGTNTKAPDVALGVDADYVITDKLPAGMDFDKITSVAVGETGWTENTEYTVSHTNNVLTITLKAQYVQALGQNKDIEIIYTAKLNANAVIAGEGNTNSAILTYNNYNTTPDTSKVYTYAMALEKYNDAGANLAGATFRFPFTATQVQAGTEATPAIYKVSAPTGTTEIVTPASGVIVVVGLDVASYTVSETEAPAGYNKLTANVEIPVEATNVATVNKTFETTQKKSVTFTAEADAGNYQIAANSIIGVENMTGTVLPSTGGIGTTIFYVLGGVMFLGALVILFTNKRMRQN